MLLFSCYSTYNPLTNSPSLTHTIPRILFIFKVLALTRPTPHQALKPPFAIHSRRYSRAQWSTQDSGCLHFPPLSFTPEDHRLPALPYQLDLGEYQGPRVKDCFLFLAKFWGISKVPTGLSPPPLCALPQSKMLSSHISRTAFVELGPDKGVEEPANCLRSPCLLGV